MYKNKFMMHIRAEINKRSKNNGIQIIYWKIIGEQLHNEKCNKTIFDQK